MLIETTPKYKTILEESIGEEKYRIIQYTNGYYALQIYKENRGYTDWILSPKPYTQPVETDIGVIGELINNQGLTDLKIVLDNIKDSNKLENGEYWELKLNLIQEGKEINFNEIITSEDGLRLIEKIENVAEAIKEAELYPPVEEEDIIEYIFKLICFGIIIACIVIIITHFI